MRLLYVFPHPDDESFGPALAISKQVREGHQVHLLTLTRGEATRQRERLGITLEEMGRIRVREMECVREVLKLASMEVLDYPDGGLDAINPLRLEDEVSRRILSIDPDVIVTYPVHGISVHSDHIVTHAVVKGAFTASAERRRRLAFFTILPTDEPEPEPLRTSSPERVGCGVEIGDEDIERARRALGCYETYRNIIEERDPIRRAGRTIWFELWQEKPEPRLTDLTQGLQTP